MIRLLVPGAASCHIARAILVARPWLWRAKHRSMVLSGPLALVEMTASVTSGLDKIGCLVLSTSPSGPKSDGEPRLNVTFLGLLWHLTRDVHVIRREEP